MMAIGVLAVIVVAVFGLFLVSKKQDEQKPAPERVDPFSDLPEDVPKTRKAAGHGATTPKDEKAPAVDPFADVATPKEDPLWLDSMAKANRGLARIEEAVAARQAGDSTTALAKGKEAQELLTEANDAVRDWALALEKKYGPEDKFVKLVQKRTTRWRRELMALKKSGGL